MALVRRFVIAFTLIATTLAVAPISRADAAGGGSRINPSTGLRVGFMPMRHAVGRSTASFAPRSSPPAVNLQYFGGPLVTSAAVENVLWGASGTYLSQVALPVAPGDINTAMSDMFASQWGKNLASYSAGGYTIGAGTVTGRTSITPSLAASGTTVEDSAIQAELLSQIAAGHLGTPTANTIYTLHFPQGTTVCDAGMGASPEACSPVQGADNTNAFCGYHGATSATDPATGLHILYVVLPYADAYYQGGCGPHSGALNATESVASHELAETITDPQVSLATGPQAPLGWYDLNYGENGDICQSGLSPAANSVESVNYQDGSGTWFSVQQIFTPQWKACVPAPPRGLSVAQTPGGRFRLTWAAPLDASQNPVHGYAIFRLNGNSWQYITQVGSTTLSYQTGAYTLGSTQTFNILGLGQDATDPSSEKQSNSSHAVAVSTPGAVTWIRTLRGGTSPVIGWATAPANYSAVTKYMITGPGGSRYVSPSARSFGWSNLRRGRYLITVRAVNRLGTGTARSFYLVN
ncbi:hypothetical protein Back2_14630 [Nocardioides baekrokdamisoli]|uniref:Fibronectin type-III domain-containing protein n=1 Tax=Nocardioides baekrokdamisoli TaxID=1804624 RepID=A0A3G9IFT3_9ACTN|nr:fibronectin type III domain-containing protein [Nocardioides baekrokdamisoli]BBH17176.1 hypothetical protein Back2_14630 [Nocardioides baekrokdamisoli]